MKDFGTSESPKSTRSSTTHWCPGRPGHPAFRHNIASSLRLHTGLPYDWTPRSDAPLGSPLAPSARRVSRVASRLPGTTRLRFALHGGQRLKGAQIRPLSVGYRCPTRHLHPSREQAFVAGSPIHHQYHKHSQPSPRVGLFRCRTALFFQIGPIESCGLDQSASSPSSCPGIVSDSAAFLSVLQSG